MTRWLSALLLFAGLGVVYALSAAGGSEQRLIRALGDPGMLEDRAVVTAQPVERSRCLKPSFRDGDPGKYGPPSRLFSSAPVHACPTSLGATPRSPLRRATYLTTRRLRI